MKKRSLFWKIVLIVLTFSVISVLVIICFKLYDQRYGIYDQKDYFSVQCDVVRLKNWKQRIINKNSGKYTTPKLDWIAKFHQNDTTTVFMAEGKRGYLDRVSGEVTIPAQYDRAWMFSEGLGGVLKDNKLGFINAKGAIVIPFQFPYDPNFDLKVDFIFKNGFCTASNSKGKHGLINNRGEWVITPQYDYITNPVKGFRIVRKNDLYGVMDSLCNLILPVRYDLIQVTKVGFVVVQNNTQQLLAFDAKTVLQPFVYGDMKELHYNSRQVTKDGEDIMIRSEYTAFNINEKWGLMDKNGKVVIKAQYSEIESLTNNIFTCQIGDYWITVNAKGEIIY